MNTINRTIRNKSILSWYASLPIVAKDGILTRSGLVAEYAREIGCPYDEIVPEMTDDDDLDFLWRNHEKEIVDFSL